jgi:PAS domain S-box-containing protein
MEGKSMPRKTYLEETSLKASKLDTEAFRPPSFQEDLRRLEDHLTRERNYRTAIYETAVGLLRRQEMSELLEAILARACALAGTQHGYLHLYDPQINMLELKIGAGKMKSAIGFRVDPGAGLAGKIYQSRESDSVDDYGNWPGRVSDPRFDGMKATLGVPLIVDEQVVGVLGLAHFEAGRTFDLDSREILLQFAEIASLVLKNAMSHVHLQDELWERDQTAQALQRRLSFEKIVSVISSRFVTSDDVNADIDDALADIGTFSYKSRAYLFQFDLIHHALSNTHEWCAVDVVPQIDRLRDLEMAAFPWVIPKLLDGQIVEIEQVATLPAAAANEKAIFELQEIQSLILVPMKIDGVVKGFIGFDDTRQIGPWRREDVALLQVVSDIIGSALQRYRTEAALRDSERRYRSVVEDMPAMVCRFRPDGTLTFVNSAYCNFFKKDRSELLGENFFRFLSDTDHPRVREHFTALGPDRPTVTCEHLVEAPDGGQGWQEWIDRALFDRNGHLVEFQSIGRDITDKRRMEMELHKVQKLESIGVLAGGIAHDFNNFLTAIVGNISLLRLYQQTGEDVGERLDEMQKAAMRAKELTQQLLTFSKGGKPVKEILQIAGLISDAAHFTLRGSNVRCDCQFPEDLWSVEIDGGQIAQVINNLVLNADQAMPGGGVITIESANLELPPGNAFSLPPGRYIRVSIRDQGMGIAREHLQRIFDPYFTTKQKGSGLGLAVSHSIVEKHSGRLSVDSELGKGSEFCLVLPAAETDRRPETVPRASPLSGQGKILVMDDETLVRDVLKKMLELLGYEVVLTREGREALEFYRDAMAAGAPCDAVILDLTIPGGMGGREAIRHLQEIDPHVRGIVSSGYSNDPVMADPRAFGFREVVSKPFQIQEIGEALRRILHPSER